MYKFYKHQNGLLEESKLYHMFFLFPLCFFIKSTELSISSFIQ